MARTVNPPMTLMHSAAALTVDLAALRANYRAFEREAAGAETAGVVKADAYGLGAPRVARALVDAGCRSFFVAHAQEGVSLRAALGAGPRIFVLHGFFPAEADLIARNSLIPVLNAPHQIRAFGPGGPGAPYALHFDTGMARLGLDPSEAPALALSHPAPALVMSHLACGDDPSHPLNAQQLAAFETVRQAFSAVPASLAASGGAFLGPRYRFEMVRPGLGLYGGAPLTGGRNPMLPVAALAAPILQIREIDTGMSAGYGATYRAPAPRRLATVGLGYADGVPRSASNRGGAIVGGVVCAFAGRVSMDLVTLDVSDCPPGTAEPGAPAYFLSAAYGVEEAAAAAGTAAYEILTRIGPRVARRYSGA
jgi:alanine racemase